MVAAFCWTFSTLIPYSQLIKKHCTVFYNNTVAGFISTDTSNMVQLNSQEVHLSSSYGGAGGCSKGPVFAIKATACTSAAVLLRALFFRVTITAVLPTPLAATDLPAVSEESASRTWPFLAGRKIVFPSCDQLSLEIFRVGEWRFLMAWFSLSSLPLLFFF